MSPFVLISLSVASTQVLSEIFSRYNTSQPQLVTDNSHPPKKETGVVDDGVIVDTTLTNLETSQEPPNNS